MNSQNYILDSSVYSDALEEISEINQDASLNTGIPRSQLLLTTIATIATMACDIALPKEYYQLTRAYLEKIKSDDGTSLPNITGCLKFIDKFEEKHNIDDEMQQTKYEIPPEEMIEVVIDEAQVHELFETAIDDDRPPLLNSTEVNTNAQEDQSKVVTIVQPEKPADDDVNVEQIDANPPLPDDLNDTQTSDVTEGNDTDKSGGATGSGKKRKRNKKKKN